MYLMTAMLSVQKKVLATGYCNSVVIILFSLTASVAAVNSMRGMVTLLGGATRDFPKSNEQ